MRSPARTDCALVAAQPIPATKRATMRNVGRDGVGIDMGGALSKFEKTIRFCHRQSQFSDCIDECSESICGRCRHFVALGGHTGGISPTTGNPSIRRSPLSTKNEGLGGHFACERVSSGLIMRCNSQKLKEIQVSRRNGKNRIFGKMRKFFAFIHCELRLSVS
jgi:hypothetical protein